MKRPPEYNKYICSARWKNISKALRKHANYTCARCGRKSSQCEVHHLNYDRLGNEKMSDLEVLCEVCHPIADQEREEEVEQRGLEAMEDAAYDTYMRKKYGEEYYFYEHQGHRGEFERWRRKKNDSFCPGNDF